MKFFVCTLFPQMLLQAADHSILGRAIKSGRVGLHTIDIRDFAVNAYGQVDDAPYGGGAGMVMMPGPVVDACTYARSLAGARCAAPIIHLSPQGEVFCQKTAREFAEMGSLVLLCGHYEGIDERALEILSPREVSIGDYVLTGGELAALVVMDAVTRLVPGVLNADSRDNDSFGASGLLEHPHYTRPPVYGGLGVPDVLTSGHHGKIARWRHEQSVLRTRRKRPDIDLQHTNNSEKDGLL